jgi:TRAP-type C4-dicarboxylate transport system permease small subunit
MHELKSDPAAPPDGVAIAHISPSVSYLLTSIDRLARIDGWIAGGALVALTLFILSGVGLRLLSKVFDNVPAGLSTSWEYSSYLLAAVFTFGSAMALRAGHHIRVTLLLSHFSRNNVWKLEVITAAVGMAVSAFVCYSLVHFTWLSLLQGQKSMSSDTPLWIPKAVVSFGFFLLALQFTGRFISAFVGLPLEDRSMRPPVPIE